MEGKIYGAICDIMSDVGSIDKLKKNTQQNYTFRGVDDVYNALQPVLVKHRVFPVPMIVSEVREDRQSAKGNNLIYTIIHVKYRFYADDGSYVDAEVVGEGMDSGDKSANKAMSVAYKYAMFQLLCIPTEAVDPDYETHAVQPKVQEPAKATPEQVKLLTQAYHGDLLNKLMAANSITRLEDMPQAKASALLTAIAKKAAEKAEQPA